MIKFMSRVKFLKFQIKNPPDLVLTRAIVCFFCAVDGRNLEKLNLSWRILLIQMILLMVQKSGDHQLI